jgi:hypothetical protein
MRILVTAVLFALAAPSVADAQTLSSGQTIEGRFSNTDPTLTDGSHFRCYRLQTQGGQRYVVDLRSRDFDAYLAVGKGKDCAGMSVEASNDDGAGQTDSRVEIVGDGEIWLLRANTLGGGEIGGFSLSATTANAPAARSRWADYTIEYQACLYRPGSGRMIEGVGKRDAEGYVLLVDGRETVLEDFGFTEGETRDWYVSSAPVRVGGRTFVKYGLPRILQFTDVTYFAEHDGVLFAAEPGVTRPEVVYALVQGVGCEFQPYQVQD